MQKIQREYKDMKESKVLNEIEELNIPVPQKMLLRECLKIGKCKSKNGRRYTNEWLLHCLLLYIRSTATYLYIYKNNIMPLCNISTIRGYLRRMHIKCGVDKEFLTAFSKKMNSKNNLQRHGMLLFDEIQVRTSMEVDVRSMKIIGVEDLGNNRKKCKANDRVLVDHALVFMFNSLMENYSQPVAVYGVKGSVNGTLLAKLILQIIIELSKAGAIIDGIICDGATTNRKMWKEFGISGELNSVTNCFKHPLTEDKNIYVFSDTPHLFKCVRNRMEHMPSLKTPEGQISWNYYKILYNLDCELPGQLRACPKLLYSLLYFTENATIL